MLHVYLCFGLSLLICLGYSFTFMRRVWKYCIDLQQCLIGLIWLCAFNRTFTSNNQLNFVLKRFLFHELRAAGRIGLGRLAVSLTQNYRPATYTAIPGPEIGYPRRGPSVVLPVRCSPGPLSPRPAVLDVRFPSGPLSPRFVVPWAYCPFKTPTSLSLPPLSIGWKSKWRKQNKLLGV